MTESAWIVLIVTIGGGLVLGIVAGVILTKIVDRRAMKRWEQPSVGFLFGLGASNIHDHTGPPCPVPGCRYGHPNTKEENHSLSEGMGREGE